MSCIEAEQRGEDADGYVLPCVSGLRGFWCGRAINGLYVPKRYWRDW